MPSSIAKCCLAILKYRLIVTIPKVAFTTAKTTLVAIFLIARGAADELSNVGPTIIFPGTKLMISIIFFDVLGIGHYSFIFLRSFRDDGLAVVSTRRWPNDGHSVNQTISLSVLMDSNHVNPCHV